MLAKLIGVWLIALAMVSVGCNKQEAPAAGPVWQPAGNEGNIGGAISFTGAPPAPRQIQMDSDAKCAQRGAQTVDDVIVNNGRLQNVFVYVKSGLPQANFAVPATPVTLDQKNCKYSPRVLGLQVGQPLQVTNSDDTNHNVHPAPKLNRQWDEAQLPGQGPITRKFSRPEVLIPVKCNLHSWMLAHIGVLPHPFYAVSASDGTFTIKGLPPGEYELEAWHERYGAKTLKVKVEAKTDARAEFSYDAATAYQPGGLTTQPALILP